MDDLTKRVADLEAEIEQWRRESFLATQARTKLVTERDEACAKVAAMRQASPAMLGLIGEIATGGNPNHELFRHVATLYNKAFDGATKHHQSGCAWAVGRDCTCSNA